MEIIVNNIRKGGDYTAITASEKFEFDWSLAQIRAKETGEDRIMISGVHNIGMYAYNGSIYISFCKKYERQVNYLRYEIKDCDPYTFEIVR